MSNNPQVGRLLTVTPAPIFAGYVVVDNTWKQTDALQVEMSRDGASNVYNYTGWSPGQKAQCEWWVKPTVQPVTALQIVTESFLILFSAQPAPASTVIIGAATATQTTYKFVAALTGAADEVLIGATLLATITNLTAAINAAAGGSGTQYGVGTVASTVAAASVNLADGYGVQVDQLGSWTSAIALAVSGTCAAASVNNVTLPTLTGGIINARTWVVAEPPETSSYGGRKLKQSVKLNYHTDGFVPQVVA